MSVATLDLLDGLGEYLADAGLAQWNADGVGYRDMPATPAVLLGDADSPDTCLVLSAVPVGSVSLGEWEVTMTYRATGVGPAAVIGIADAISRRFIALFDFQTKGTWHGGTLVTLPSITLPRGLTIVGLAQIEWGAAELSSPAKHKGSRYVRTDKYRMVVRET